MVAIYIQGETLEGACPNTLRRVLLEFSYGIFNTQSINIFRRPNKGKLSVSGFFIRISNDIDYRSLENITRTYLKQLPGFTLTECMLNDDPDYEVYKDTLETYSFQHYGIDIINV
jgi:hypothetical protein